jgi:FMN phosphatase YigB (HAD superfamily)
MIKQVWIDLDDTLISNTHAYHIPMLDCIKLMCIDLVWDSPNPFYIIKRINEIQAEAWRNAKKPDPTIFSNAIIQTYKEICKTKERKENNNIISALAQTSARYFLEKYHLKPLVLETLDSLKYKKILVTKGYEPIQNYKIENTGLREHFDSIEIVDEKNIVTYKKLLKKYKVKSEEVIMIGDSLTNDIVPTLEIGMKVIHIDTHPDWELIGGNTDIYKEFLEKYSHNLIKVKSFSEVTKYLG